MVKTILYHLHQCDLAHQVIFHAKVGKGKQQLFRIHYTPGTKHIGGI